MQNNAATLGELLETALGLDPAVRLRWLDSLNLQDDALRSRLRALLERAAALETSDFLDTLPKLDASPDPRGYLHVGDVVGAYRLLREIGTGGMGAVWLAERADGGLKRPVALKFLHGHVPGEAFAQRLARERDILATLVHPGIARLYDAGFTEAGVPFLALEYVDGIHLDRYCALHSPSLRARLDLFLQVARAVAYAHAKLVVHRDLKPANILVSDDGQAHLLDFGIAKLLEDGQGVATQLTRATGRVGTPEYASPEQLLGEHITIASDVYSLGVILYELLAGVRPYQPKRTSPASLEEAILETDPQRPSERAIAGKQALRGDLDAIVLKALRKAPEKRYSTVNALIDDLERYLQGRPVVAQPDHALYRLGKLVTRNRAAVAASALVLLSIVGSAAFAWMQKLEADRQRDAAVHSQRRAEAFSTFLTSVLQDAGPNSQLTPTQLLDRGAKMLERQALPADDTAYLYYEISRTYHLFNQTESELALLDRSIAAARNFDDRSLLAASQCASASSLMNRDRKQAQARFSEAQTTLATLDSPASFVRFDCVRARARLLAADGDSEGAIRLLEDLRGSLTGEELDGWQHFRLTSELSSHYVALDRFRDSIGLTKAWLDSLAASGRTDSLTYLTALNNYATHLARMGEISAAHEMQLQVVEWVDRQSLPGMQPVNLRSNAAVTYLALGQPMPALELIEADLAVAKQAGNLAGESIDLLLGSRALAHLGRMEEADRWLEQADAIWTRDSKRYGRMLRESAQHRVEMLKLRGQVREARELIDVILSEAGYPQQVNAPGIDRTLRLASEVHRLDGDVAGAEALAAHALEYSRRIARDESLSADVGRAALLLAQAKVAQGRALDAREYAQLAATSLSNALADDHPETLAARRLIDL